ncbi:NADPH-dependent FMN reductase [soil metagenome]
MHILLVSTSHDPESRSEQLARLCGPLLTEAGAEHTLLRLKDFPLPPYTHGDLALVPGYTEIHQLVLEADALVLASPVYNWGCCAELKKFIEYFGSTDASHRGALFDKVVTFLNAAGLPHSYMAFTGTATSLMLDFKCIINPYNVYVHDRHWTEGTLVPEASARLKKSMEVTVELARLLSQRTYSSSWEI